ncbi:exocyst complex component Sec10-domain-containing protein [Catenaria anguillulae PL171]|uniref:Exocyst complex component Sec10-domain-containing protein n=1 Tax=Catenaria anguillulae PL171 TaxID=765915 RepID=A0A1Y2I545_9FUNG|nr:exocyst complex component Sec10-domain-containing protein [Catenaria anguillulae PL171]
MSEFLRVPGRSRASTSGSSSGAPTTASSSRATSSLGLPGSAGTTIRLAAFPQDVTLRIFSFLPLHSLAQLAACSRRLKVLAYNDVLYERKFRVWYYLPPSNAAGAGPASMSAAAGAGAGAAVGGLKPPPLDPEKIPLHIKDAWTRLAPTVAARAGGAGPGAVMMGGGIGLPPGQQAREAFRRVHSVLWPMYREFRNGSNAGSAKLLDGCADPVDQAMYFALVKQFGRGAVVDDFASINENIQTGLQVLESQLLSAFDRHYDSNDIAGMQQLAKCLFYLTGGDSCVQLFIYKSPIFFDHVKDVTENFKSLSLPTTTQSPDSAIATTAASSTLTSPSSPTKAGGHDLGADAGISPLQRYLNTMSATLETQLPLIRTVFPHPTPSQYAFVNKVFDECILDYLTRLLREAQSRDLAVFLASLSHMFEHCSALLRQLADHHGLDARILEESLQHSLKPFTGDEYMQREIAHLRGVYAKHLDTWSDSVAARRAKMAAVRGGEVKMAVPDPNLGRRVLSSVKTALLTPGALVQRVVNRGGDKYTATLALTGSPGTSPVEASFGVPGPFSPVADTSPTEDEPGANKVSGFDQLDSLLSVDMVLAMIALNKESLKRCVVMMKRTGDVKKHVERLFAVLTQTLSERHIKPSFEIATDRLSSYKASEDLEVIPLIQFFSMIQVVDVILQMVHLYFTEELANYVNLNDFLSDSIQEKKKFEKVIDDCVATGLDRAMITLMSQTEFLLFTEQHPSDFEPPDDLMTDTRPTDACRLSVACLEKHIEMLRACAEKNILNVFLGEVGSRFFSVLCKHIKRQRISVMGGFRLMCDINAYHKWAETLRNGEVSRMFKALKELSNIYIVTDLPALKQLVKDQNRFVGVFRVEDVYEFIERRADYDRIKGKVKESDCCIM